MLYFITTAGVRLRTSPVLDKTNENVLTYLTEDEVVDVTNINDPVFFKVSCLNRKPVINGYAAKQYLKPQAQAATNTISNMKPVNLPANPGSRRNSTDYRQCPLSENNMPTVDGKAPAADRIIAMHQVVAYLKVDKSARYLPDNYTYCNIYAYDYGFLAGVFIPRVWWSHKALLQLQQGPLKPVYEVNVSELRANDLFNWFQQFGADYNWTRTYDVDDLQTKVNEGRVGVICAAAKNDNAHGHIVLVLPENADHQATRASGKVICPLLSQAGRKNLPYYNNNRWWITMQDSFRGYGFWYCDYV